ncbi:undecaprenyl/decaprenyl-phosphate alpha-N-acetylglucosaminyl 1-phosphate transferase [Candidatus Woesebacteria bacterium]|nr:MAG: undecaprenyl/decaprenyl-phosphate alpha-N-acetylglucosaminyl 1-phosphate transferase [Candidatus Woesebacteria bacterium]
MTLISLIILPLIVSFMTSYLSTPWVIKFATRFNLIDDPKVNKHPKVLHKRPIPRAGGLATFIGVLAGIVFFLPLDKHIVAIAIGALIIVVLGILDDKYNIHPLLRLIAMTLAALIPIASGIGIAFATSPLGGLIDLSYPRFEFFLMGEERSIWILSDIFALFWIVFMMNILNMGAKGIQGQLPGVTAIAATTIVLLSTKFTADITEWPVMILAVITTGAYLGFLPWNFFPQKIMPGFAGSTLAGYLLAVLSILSTAKVGTLLIVLGIPIVDTLYTIFRRIASGKSPFWGDRGHLHHKLLDSGLSQKQVVYFYWATTCLLGALALNLNASHKLYTIIGITIFTGGLLLFLTHKPKNVNN